jgi:tetratricopeptide (TPR) repeat protein
MRLVILLAALLVIAVPRPAAAQWRSLTTEHFQLIGDVPERQLRDVALRFEQFRDIVTGLNVAATKEDGPSRVPIVVFRDRRSFEPFMPRAGGHIVETAGMFVEGPDAVYIALRLDGGAASYRAAFHEYTHLLLRQAFPDAPLWLDEGLADYYSTLRITGDRSALIGLPLATHITVLRESSMPLTQMFGATHQSAVYTGTDRVLFYAQAWAMVHHAYHSRPSLEAEMIALAKRLAAGGNAEESVRVLYGMSIAELELRITEYVRSGRYGGVDINFEQDLINAVTESSVAITDAEADVWLGDLLAQSGRDDEAQPRFENALRRQPDLAQAHEALALLLFRKNQNAEADSHLQQARTLGRNVDAILGKTRSTAFPAGFRQSVVGLPPPPPGARPNLRITLAGEQRAFGVLESLDCRGSQVEFVVRTTDGVVVRARGRFADVQVVSFRQGSLGDLPCGLQLAPLPALLTWTTAGDLDRAVAVEFVPDGFVP